MPARTRYVGRGTRWGNPHPVDEPCGPCGGTIHSRAEAIATFREHLAQQPNLMARVGELAGRNLACWCPPGPCHADVLLELANGAGTATVAAHDASPAGPRDVSRAAVRDGSVPAGVASRG